MSSIATFMSSDRAKIYRDWINLVLTIFLAIFVPWWSITLKNLRLEIRQDVQRDFVHRETFTDYRNDHKTWAEKETVTLNARIDAANAKSEKVEAKVDAVSAKLDAQMMSLNSVQVQLQMITRQQMAPTGR